MRAISLWQPWATAIAVGLKKIETRHWPTAYRGPLAIHAAKRWTSEEREFCEDARVMDPGYFPEVLPLGAIVATCRLVDCKNAETANLEIEGRERLYGNYASGRYAWILTDVVPLPKPIPFKGAQGFFNVPDELLDGREWSELPGGKR